MTRFHLHASRTRVAGFTLLEMMVALTAGFLAITGIYYLGGASSRHFQEQQRIAQTQMSLRMAMTQLRTDISRAGFFGTPNSRVERRCTTPPVEIQGIEMLDNIDTPVLPNAGANLANADRLRLVGNYASNDAYFVRSFSATGSRVFLQQEWQGFRRDFGVAGIDFSPETFNEVFLPGRMLHIQTPQGMHFFVTIVSADPTNGAVDFTPGVGIGGPCVSGLGGGALVAPLSRMEYAVVDPRLDPELAALRSTTPAAVELATGRIPSVLVRREIQFNSDNVLPGTTRVVLEYVSEFELAGVFDDTLNPGDPPNLVPRIGAAAADEFRLRPHHARTVGVLLSARTADQDDRFPFVARAPGQPLTRYQVNPALPGAARVRSASAEILLPNFAGRNLRP